MVKGDVLFYDWGGQNGCATGISHSSLQAGFGYSLHGHYGTFVDAQTNDRYHARWTLVYYNKLC